MTNTTVRILKADIDAKADGDYPTLRDKIRAEKIVRERRYWAFHELVKLADLAGKKAADATMPEPMIVQEHANPLDDNSPVVKTYAPVMSGVCGFAWVTVRPANSSFAIWANKNVGWRKSYGGGMQLWVSAYGQSMERKAAYADAYAATLREAGISASSGSRMD